MQHAIRPFYNLNDFPVAVFLEQTNELLKEYMVNLYYKCLVHDFGNHILNSSRISARTKPT